MKSNPYMIQWTDTLVEEKKMKKSITTFADLELHVDGSLHLDGVNVRDKNQPGEGLVAYIHPDNVYEFLESAMRLTVQLKKLGLYKKSTLPDSGKEG